MMDHDIFHMFTAYYRYNLTSDNEGIEDLCANKIRKSTSIDSADTYEVKYDTLWNYHLTVVLENRI